MNETRCEGLARGGSSAWLLRRVASLHSARTKSPAPRLRRDSPLAAGISQAPGAGPRAGEWQMAPADRGRARGRRTGAPSGLRPVRRGGRVQPSCTLQSARRGPSVRSLADFGERVEDPFPRPLSRLRCLAPAGRAALSGRLSDTHSGVTEGAPRSWPSSAQSGFSRVKSSSAGLAAPRRLRAAFAPRYAGDGFLRETPAQASSAQDGEPAGHGCLGAGAGSSRYVCFELATSAWLAPRRSGDAPPPAESQRRALCPAQDFSSPCSDRFEPGASPAAAALRAAHSPRRVRGPCGV